MCLSDTGNVVALLYVDAGELMSQLYWEDDEDT